MMNSLRSRIVSHRITQLLIKTCIKWQKDRCLEMGAALAYYALFSIFPIFLVIASILGFLLGPDTDTSQRILALTRDSLPSEAQEIVRNTLLQLNQQSVGAGIVGIFLMFFTASSVFGAMDRSVDTIWKAREDDSGDRNLLSNVLAFLRKKILAFALVICSAAILLLSLILNIVVKVVLDLVGKMQEGVIPIELDTLLIARALQIGSSFILLSVAVMFLQHFLPSTYTPWHDILPGTVLTTVLLMSLQKLVSQNVIEIGAQYQSYGAIGGVMILMLWIYLTCQIFFLGCEFSYVYAHIYGSRQHCKLEL